MTAPVPRSTMKDVAARAGVAVTTVSRVINGDPKVAAETRERVRAAITALHYQPDLHAGNLRRRGRTNTLGLLVGNVANPFSASVHRAVEDVARPHHVAVFASSLDDDPARERESIEAFLRRRVDGLILTTVGHDHTYLAREIERGTPIVFVDRRPSGVIGDTVLSDNYAGARLAVAHLAGHGHRRIAFLGDDEQIFTARERRRGYLDECRELGLDLHPGLVVTGLSDEGRAAAAVAALVASSTPPSALFSAQNLITIGAITALRQAGVEHRLAVVGFDDIPMAEHLTPPVTVVAQDPRRIGREAAELIFARMDGDTSAAREIVVPTRLVCRGSGEIPSP
ncbi:LacI family DNA-binding transcriptional regulator [Tessaracoccus sp. Z1128]